MSDSLSDTSSTSLRSSDSSLKPPHHVKRSFPLISDLRPEVAKHLYAYTHAARHAHLDHVRDAPQKLQEQLQQTTFSTYASRFERSAELETLRKQANDQTKASLLDILKFTEKDITEAEQIAKKALAGKGITAHIAHQKHIRDALHRLRSFSNIPFDVTISQYRKFLDEEEESFRIVHKCPEYNACEHISESKIVKEELQELITTEIARLKKSISDAQTSHQEAQDATVPSEKLIKQDRKTLDHAEALLKEFNNMIDWLGAEFRHRVKHSLPHEIVDEQSSKSQAAHSNQARFATATASSRSSSPSSRHSDGSGPGSSAHSSYEMFGSFELFDATTNA